MFYNDMADDLRQGKVITCRPQGHSMEPRIKHLQLITLSPITKPLEQDDIVLAKVAGRYYIHRIEAMRDGKYLIANNKGHVNGTVRIGNIFGVVTKIGP